MGAGEPENPYTSESIDWSLDFVLAIRRLCSPDSYRHLPRHPRLRLVQILMHKCFHRQHAGALICALILGG